MRRVFPGIGTVVLALATMMWATAPLSAQRDGDGGDRTAAHAGSVHYGARAAPARVGPAVWAGAVRSEHYAGFTNPVPNISGVWYMRGDPDLPCQILQRQLDGRALFINENGSSAWGTVHRNVVSIPDWSDGSRQGLVGRIRGNRIIWTDNSFWAR